MLEKKANFEHNLTHPWAKEQTSFAPVKEIKHDLIQVGE